MEQNGTQNWLVLTERDTISRQFLLLSAAGQSEAQLLEHLWPIRNSAALLEQLSCWSSSGKSEAQLLSTTGTVTGFCTKPPVMPYFSEFNSVPFNVLMET